MKKSITKILLLISLVVCVFSLAACGGVGSKPETDLEKAAENLEKLEYIVIYDDSEDVFSGYEEHLFAAHKDGKTITIIAFKTRKLARIYLEAMNLEYELELEKLEIELETLEYQLDEFKDELDSDEIEELEEKIEELKEEIKEEKEEFSYGRKGKVIWHGDTEAIEDTK